MPDVGPFAFVAGNQTPRASDAWVNYVSGSNAIAHFAQRHTAFGGGGGGGARRFGIFRVVFEWDSDGTFFERTIWRGQDHLTSAHIFAWQNVRIIFSGVCVVFRSEHPEEVFDFFCPAAFASAHMVDSAGPYIQGGCENSSPVQSAIGSSRRP